MADYITKGITSTIVKGFVLDAETMQAKETTLEFEGAFTRDRAEGKARKAIGSILITSVEQTRKYYKLERSVAMENATDERTAKDDIQIGETGTTVYFVKLVKPNSHETELACITFDAPMTESRAFGAARRACGYDILPYTAEQNRTAHFISRAKFFELAQPITEADAIAETEDDSAEA